jgi:hypothetical protein
MGAEVEGRKSSSGALTNRNFFQAGRTVVLLKSYGRSGWGLLQYLLDASKNVMGAGVEGRK